MADLESNHIDRLTEEITSMLSDRGMDNILDDAIAEFFTHREIEALGPEGMGRVQATWLGRALMRAAEQQLILAVGLAADSTPSRVQVG